MFQTLRDNCGLFIYPQLAVSIIVVALVGGYLLAWLRRELPHGESPWRSTLVPMAELAVSLGLLGSVIGFVSAFGSFQNGIDVPALTRGLATAYYTTAVGLTTSIVAALGAYLLGVLPRRKGGA